MNNLIEILNSINNHKKGYLILFIAFTSGLIIPTIPYSFKLISNLRTKRAIELNNKNFIMKLEEDCKSKNSKYKKLIELGFQNFAIKELNICIKESLREQTF